MDEQVTEAVGLVNENELSMFHIWTYLRNSHVGAVSLSVLILAGGIGGLLLLKQLNAPPKTKADVEAVPRVLTALVEPHADGFAIEADGQVVPFRRVTVAAEVAGRVETKSDVCQEGRYVEQGTVLAKLDDRDYQLEVTRLEQQVRQAEVSIAELEQERDGTHELIQLAQTDVELKQREVDRLKAIKSVLTATDLERAQSQLVLAQQSLRQLQNQYNVLQTRWDRLQSALALANAQLERARLDLERTTITAPLSGMIIEDSFEAGDYVQKGSPLVTQEDNTKVEVRTSLEMRDLFWVWGQRTEELASSKEVFQLPVKKQVEVVYTLAGLRERRYTWPGRLDRFEGFGLDERTRTVPCRIVVDEPRRVGSIGPPVLLPGMFVTVRIPVEPRFRLLQIPSRALRPGNVVWRVRGGKLTLVQVELVRFVGDEDELDPELGRAIIHAANEDDLRVGDAVAVTPLAFVKSGMAVDGVPWEASVSREEPEE